MSTRWFPKHTYTVRKQDKSGGSRWPSVPECQIDSVSSEHHDNVTGRIEPIYVLPNSRALEWARSVVLLEGYLKSSKLCLSINERLDVLGLTGDSRLKEGQCTSESFSKRHGGLRCRGSWQDMRGRDEYR